MHSPAQVHRERGAARETAEAREGTSGQGASERVSGETGEAVEASEGEHRSAEGHGERRDKGDETEGAEGEGGTEEVTGGTGEKSYQVGARNYLVAS